MAVRRGKRRVQGCFWVTSVSRRLEQMEAGNLACGRQEG